MVDNNLHPSDKREGCQSKKDPDCNMYRLTPAGSPRNPEKPTAPLDMWNEDFRFAKAKKRISEAETANHGRYETSI
jgi:hypothetical protein